MIVSWIKGKALVLVGSVALCAIVWGGLASSLYVSSQKELSSLQEKHTQLETKLNESIESKKTLEKSCEITKKSLREVLVKLGNVETNTTSSVTGIETYKPKCVQPRITSVEEGVLNEIEYVDIDAPLDPEFIRLSESGISN